VKSFCKLCGDPVNLDDEGVTYRDGSCAHDGCDDRMEWDKANGADERDRDGGAR
jgi:hypothetical protein